MDEFFIGQVVELVEMNDVAAPPVGTRGIVEGMNQIKLYGQEECQVSIRWENGSRIMVLLPYDKIKVVK